MTPTRANEILNTESTIMKGFKLIDVGKVRTAMTNDEIDEVNRLWDTMPGSASFSDALRRLARTSK